MDNDQRDRRDWPASDQPGDPAEEASRPAGETPAAGSEAPMTGGTPPPEDTTAPAEPVPAGSSSAEPTGAELGDRGEMEPSAMPPGETRTWPSEEVGSGEATSSEDAADQPWPTEPPSAGSAPPGAWPTSPPEPGGEGPSEPAPELAWTSSAQEDQPSAGFEPTGEPPAEPVPSEAEAYPAAPQPASAPYDEAGVAAAGAAGLGASTAQTVPDAESSATGESTQCPRCGTENRAGLAFCRNCGQRLVAAGVATTVERPGAPEGAQACPRCGTHNRSGVAFCQNCGANLRGTAPGYVPPAAATGDEPAAAPVERGGAVLGPVVLLIGMIGLVTGYLLPFLYGSGESLFDRAFSSGGYGAAFWSAYPDVEAGLADQAYFGLAAPVPLFAALLAVLAVAGFVRARPGGLQTVGLVIALIWSVGLAVLFVVVEVLGNFGGDIVGLLRDLTPAGIILFLASLIVLIGTLTRFGRS